MQKIQILQIKLNINCVIFYLFLKELLSFKIKKSEKTGERTSKQTGFIYWSEKCVFREWMEVDWNNKNCHPIKTIKYSWNHFQYENVTIILTCA